MPEPSLNLDQWLLVALRTRGHGPRVDRAVELYSRTGEHAAWWLALGSVGSLIDPRTATRPRWRRGTAIVAASYGLNTALKLLIGRPRPTLPGLPPLTGVVSELSMPSAHSTTSFAAARAYAGPAPAWLLYTLALGFALSRPYLGVHYPSDVLAGAVLGTALAGLWPGEETTR